MMKMRLRKIWRAILGIATEVLMAILIMLTAWGLSWLIVRGIK